MSGQALQWPGRPVSEAASLVQAPQLGEAEPLVQVPQPQEASLAKEARASVPASQLRAVVVPQGSRSVGAQAPGWVGLVRGVEPALFEP